jgi:nitrite reductase (NADH) large subunit
VGLSYVRQKLVDDAAGRRQLAERFLQSQRFAQTDPWAERAAGSDAAEFAALEASPGS